MTQRFEKAYNSLVRAYFEGTLAKGTCLACACGNIILDALGMPLTKEVFDSYLSEGKSSDRCTEMHTLSIDTWAIKRGTKVLNNDGVEIYGFEAKPTFLGVVNPAGYTTEEFAEIETAFESNVRISYSLYREYYERGREQEILEDQYNGLCAVLDVLMKLDEKTEGGNELKQKFREHPKLVA